MQYLNKIKNSKDGRTLLSNFGYLTLLQVAGYIFPFITLPYLARVIGVDGFGKIAFASAVIVWFQTIADWGFNFTATRDVAKNKDNPEKVSEIFSNVLWARCILMLVSLALLLGCIAFIPKFQENASVIMATFLMIPGLIMFPEWFFQALEKMKYITYFSLFVKFFFTALIFVFIKSPEDYVLQPLITSVGYILCGFVAMYIITKKWGYKIRRSSFRQILDTIKSSTDVFVNNLFPNIYNSFSTLLLGFVGGPTANGILDAGGRFEKVVRQFLNIISRTFFPFLSRKIDKHHLYAKISIGIAFLAFAGLFVCAPFIIDIFYTEEFEGAVPVLRIMALSLVFYALSNVYGTNYLIIQGRDRELRKITVVCSIIGFFLSLVLVNLYSYIGAAITITVTRGLMGICSMIKAEQSKFRVLGLRLIRRWGHLLPDKLFLKWTFRLYMRQKLDLKHPQTFSEKLQWLKLYNRRPEYTVMVDKYLVRRYIAEKIGEEYLIPLIGVWDSPEEIDFDALPDRFVLKCNHNSGIGMCICKDKSKLDVAKVREELRRGLAQDYYKKWREWPYKDVPRKIICEQYMEDESGELRDYKFFCFDGKVRAMFVATERSKGDDQVKFDFFDSDFQHLPFTQGHPNSPARIEQPKSFEKMKQLAGELSKGFAHLRVDFYEINGRIYFGELTFSHFSGFVPFEPPQWDKTFGDWIELPDK